MNLIESYVLLTQSSTYLYMFEITNLVSWKPLFIHDQGYIRIIITKIIRNF
jgi:hypothetical protein